jgi:aspartyl-tRNA(Asn)/glutamyl-tRNA(Gln) amidotransferase subunit C
MKRNVKLKTKNAKLTEEEVRHVAKLAKLELGADEIEKFQKQLSEILDYVALLNEVETGKVEPTSQVTGLENVFRKDKVEKSLSQEEALFGAKNKQQGRFKVKAILEK